MERVSRDTVLMDIAGTVAQRGTCSRLLVGAVFSRDGRVVATGYNGAPSGMPHCDHQVWEPGAGQMMPSELARLIVKDGAQGGSSYSHLLKYLVPGYFWNINQGQLDITQGEPAGCAVAGHAERNGIAFAARHGVALGGCEMHVTHLTCYNCADMVINAGIMKVTYGESYRSLRGLELMQQAGIEVVDFNNLKR